MATGAIDPEVREENGEEDASFSSPPCFMHEVTPEYLGYMGQVEIRALLRDLLDLIRRDAGPVAVRPTDERMLARHLAALPDDGAAPDAGDRAAEPLRASAGAESGDGRSGSTSRQLTELLGRSLLRIYPSPLRDDLDEMNRRLLSEAGERDAVGT